MEIFYKGNKIMSDELYTLAEQLMKYTSYSYEEACQGIKGVSSIGLDHAEIEMMVKEFINCST